jgi:transposase
VEWFVEWGLAHRQLRGVESIGVDEIHLGRGLRADDFLTVIYQIDAHCRRLLWVGRRRSQATLWRGLKALGPELVRGLRFVCKGEISNGAVEGLNNKIRVVTRRSFGFPHV